MVDGPVRPPLPPGADNVPNANPRWRRRAATVVYVGPDGRRRGSKRRRGGVETRDIAGEFVGPRRVMKRGIRITRGAFH